MASLDAFLADQTIDWPAFDRASSSAREYGHALFDDARSELMDVAEAIFEVDGLDDKERVNLATELFARAPSYTVGMQISTAWDDLSIEAKEQFWSWVVPSLESGGVLARELEYTITIDDLLDRSQPPAAAIEAVKVYQQSDPERRARVRLDVLTKKHNGFDEAALLARCSRPLPDSSRAVLRAVAATALEPRDLRAHVLCELFHVAPSAPVIEVVDSNWHELASNERDVVVKWVVRQIVFPSWIAQPWEQFVVRDQGGGIASDLPDFAADLLDNENWNEWRRCQQ